MVFDIDGTIKDMIHAAKGELTSGGKNISDALRDFFNERKDRLLELARRRINNEITAQDLDGFLADEKDTFKDEMLAVKVMSKSALQQAANAAVDVFYNAVSAAAKI